MVKDSTRISKILLATLKREIPDGHFNRRVIAYMLDSCKSNLAGLELKLPDESQEQEDNDGQEI